MNSNICFIDFETSGIDIYKDSPIEIGAVLIDSSGNFISEFHSYIKPRTKRNFTRASIEIHGIQPETVLNAPTQKAVLNDFFTSFGNDFRFGGWNVNFDVSFFKSMCHYSNMMRKFKKINHRHLDVQSINYLLNHLGVFNGELNSLSDLCQYFSITRSNNHSAIEDAKLTAQVYFKMVNILKEKIAQSPI